jgi:hypothetical protein
MAIAILGLTMLGQVVCFGTDLCAQPIPDPVEVAAVDAEPVCELPICGPLGQRLYCVEGYESRHYGGAYNPSSGAKGYLQWLPGTARQWGVVIGNRQSEWSAAAQIASLGETYLRSQWVPIQRGLC